MLKENELPLLRYVANLAALLVIDGLLFIKIPTVPWYLLTVSIFLMASVPLLYFAKDSITEWQKS